MGWTTEEQWFNSLQRQGIFTSRNLPNQPYVQLSFYVMAIYTAFPGIKQSEHECEQLPPYRDINIPHVNMSL